MSIDGGNKPGGRALFQADEAPGVITGRGGTRWAAADAESLADIWFQQQEKEREKAHGAAGRLAGVAEGEASLPTPGAPRCSPPPLPFL